MKNTNGIWGSRPPKKYQCFSNYGLVPRSPHYAKVRDKRYIIRDAKGHATQMVSDISDISKLVDQKDALKSVNERYRMAIKATRENKNETLKKLLGPIPYRP